MKITDDRVKELKDLVNRVFAAMEELEDRETPSSLSGIFKIETEIQGVSFAIGDIKSSPNEVKFSFGYGNEDGGGKTLRITLSDIEKLQELLSESAKEFYGVDE